MKSTPNPNKMCVINVNEDAFLEIKKYCDDNGYKISKWASIQLLKIIKQENESSK